MTPPAAAVRPFDPAVVRRVPPVVLVPAAWLVIGLGLGLCQYGALRLSGSGVSLAEAVEGPLLGTALWIPLSGLAIGVARRPLGRARSLILLAVLAGLSSLILNAAFQGVHWLAPGGVAHWDRVLPDTIHFLPFNAAAFLTVAFLTRWWMKQEAPPPAPPVDTLEVREGTGLLRMPTKDIVWIEARGDYARLHAAQGNYLVSRRMDDLAESLASAGFVRIHRSAIVNLHRVREVRPRGHGDGQVVLQDGTPLRVARSRRSALIRELERRPSL